MAKATIYVMFEVELGTIAEASLEHEFKNEAIESWRIFNPQNYPYTITTLQKEGYMGWPLMLHVVPDKDKALTPEEFWEKMEKNLASNVEK